MPQLGATHSLPATSCDPPLCASLTTQVELVRGMQTSDATFAASRRLAAHLGKSSCEAKDRPGFIVNRILMPMVNEAFYALMEVRCTVAWRGVAWRAVLCRAVLCRAVPCRAVLCCDVLCCARRWGGNSGSAHGARRRSRSAVRTGIASAVAHCACSLRRRLLAQGVGTAADIDMGMHLGTNQPMGPLALADFIGLDTCLAILEVLHSGLGEKYRPCPLLRQYVEAGWLGRKAGRGVYEY